MHCKKIWILLNRPKGDFNGQIGQIWLIRHFEAIFSKKGTFLNECTILMYCEKMDSIESI